MDIERIILYNIMSILPGHVYIDSENPDRVVMCIADLVESTKKLVNLRTGELCIPAENDEFYEADITLRINNLFYNY